jgi:hypothetical protein
MYSFLLPWMWDLFEGLCALHTHVMITFVWSERRLSNRSRSWGNTSEFSHVRPLLLAMITQRHCNTRCKYIDFCMSFCVATERIAAHKQSHYLQTYERLPVWIWFMVLCSDGKCKWFCSGSQAYGRLLAKEARNLGSVLSTRANSRLPLRSRVN